MKLSVPFIADDPYIDFLVKNKSLLSSVYFALPDGPVLDARVQFGSLDLHFLQKHLPRLGKIKTYCLFNTRFITPDRYFDTRFLNQILDRLQALDSISGLSGIVFSDMYLLAALSKTGHKQVKFLEAVPGINMMLDNAPKAFSMLAAIRETCFKMPEKLVVDRSLNRDFNGLEKMVSAIRQACPDVGIELMANEGCLSHCPFKLTHDAQVSLSNTRLVPEMTHRISQVHGCHDFFQRHPHYFFSSPFIRPEDLAAYSHLADTVKISGRTLGSRFLIQAVNAYIHKSFDGNLLELMDATRFLADAYHVDNKQLGPDFLYTLAGCNHLCVNCTRCRDLFNRTARQQTLILKPYKDRP